MTTKANGPDDDEEEDYEEDYEEEEDTPWDNEDEINEPHIDPDNES